MSARYKLLVLATRYAIPPDGGASADIHLGIEQLQKQGVDVRVILVDNCKGQPTALSGKLLAGMVTMPWWQSHVALVKALVTGRSFAECKWFSPEVVALASELHSRWPFDLVQAASSFHMANALAVGRRCGVKVVMRAQNVEYIICRRMVDAMPTGPRRTMWRREARLLRRLEGQWCRSADLCLPISDVDCAELRVLAPETPMHTVQAGAAVMPVAVADRPDEVLPHFLHMGNLDWPPRMDGLLWFLREVWPILRGDMPDARLSIAGTASDAAREKLAPWRNHGVTAMGFVEDISPLARECAAVVVPMRCGSGIKIRVITAWANGWPVVGTPLMGEGIPAENGVNCLIADDPAGLAAAMRRICTDSLLRGKIIRAGIEAHRLHFSWEAIGREMIDAHERCIKGERV